MSWIKISEFLGGKLYLVDTIPKNDFGENNDKALKLNDYSLYLFQENSWVKQGYITEKPRNLDYFEEDETKNTFIKNKPELEKTLKLIDEIGNTIQSLEQDKNYFIDISKTVTQNQIVITASKASETKTYINLPITTKNEAGIITSLLYDIYTNIENNLHEDDRPKFQGIFNIVNNEDIINTFNKNIQTGDIFLLKLKLNGNFNETFFINFLDEHSSIKINNYDYVDEIVWVLCSINISQTEVIFSVHNKNVLFKEPLIASELKYGTILSSNEREKLKVEENGTSKINNLVRLNNKLFSVQNPTLQNIKDFSFEDIGFIWDKYGNQIENIFAGEKPIPNDSTITLRNDTVIEFNAINTPLQNFCSNSWGTGATFTVNNIPIIRDDIKKIVFGDTYLNTTDIDGSGYLLFACNYLENVNLSGLRNLIHAGGAFSNLERLFNLDLSPLSNVQSFNQGGFVNTDLNTIDLSPCTKLTALPSNFIKDNPYLASLNISTLTNLKEWGFNCVTNNPSLMGIYIGSVDFTNVSCDNFCCPPLSGSPNSMVCTVFADTIQLANIFKNWVSSNGGNISNWQVRVG